MLAKTKKYGIQDFSLLSVFGYGNYAKVALVRKKDDMHTYAMKIIKKKGKIKGVKKSHAFIQKQILLKCTHPFIIKMHTTFQDQTRLFFILDYCPGGQLFGLLRRIRRLSQQQCRFYAAQILMALQYLHSHKIIYRDLKPQNVLLDKDGYIRLVDFGLSIYQRSSSELSERDLAGTVYYLAPEALSKSSEISYASDWWSFGSLIFEMSMGFPPFYSQKQGMKKLIEKIRNNDPPLQYINSEVQRDFLRELMIKDPKRRLGAKGVQSIKNHPWLRGVDWEKIIRKALTPPFLPKLSGDTDISWFDDDEHPMTQLSPPEANQISEIKNQEYRSFSLSWQSSGERSPRQTSPIQLKIQGLKEQEEKPLQLIQYEAQETTQIKSNKQ